MQYSSVAGCISDNRDCPVGDSNVQGRTLRERARRFNGRLVASPFGGGVMGAWFAIGTVLIFLIGLPPSRWFLLRSAVLGVGVPAVLYVWHKNHPVEQVTNSGSNHVSMYSIDTTGGLDTHRDDRHMRGGAMAAAAAWIRSHKPSGSKGKLMELKS
jgi:hypothetical protein